MTGDRYTTACTPGGDQAANLPVVPPGTVLELGEDDYRFGIGPLTLRVSEVLDVQHLTDGLWLYVQGIPILWDGRDGELRQVLVRVAAVAQWLRG